MLKRSVGREKRITCVIRFAMQISAAQDQASNSTADPVGTRPGSPDLQGYDTAPAALIPQPVRTPHRHPSLPAAHPGRH